jgi:uncharacterized protein
LAFILEGLLPFISPKKWREMVEQVRKMHDGQIRFFGMVAIGVGLALMWLA